MTNTDSNKASSDEVVKLLDHLVQGVQEIPHSRVSLGDQTAIKESMERYYKARAKWVHSIAEDIEGIIAQKVAEAEKRGRIDEVKLYTNSINETGGGFDPIQYEKNRQQDLEKTDNILGSKIVIDTHMEKMGKVASMIEKLPGAQDSYKDRLTQLLDRFRLQWKIEGDEYHQSELEDDIIRLFIDSIGVFEVSKGDGSQQDQLTNERNSIRDSIMEKWGLYDD